jgi:AcrR family transcriptional regulator
MTENTDRRVRRSRRLLADALLELIVAKGYDAVTVQEIADRADLNRATFYLHFNSKEELLVAGLEERFDELVATMNQVAATEPVWENPAHDLLLFRHVAENAAIYKALIGDHGLGWVMHRVIGYIAREVERELVQDLPEGARVDAPLPLVANFTAGALFGLIAWWLANDLPYSPEEMARIADRLCVRGVMGVVAADFESGLSG